MINIHKLFHILFPSRCRNKLEWQGNVLCCSKCGTVVATRYVYNNEVRIVVFTEHSDLKSAIAARDDNAIIRGPDDIIGEVTFEEWEDFIREEVRKIQSIEWHMPIVHVDEEEEEPELFD